MKNKGKQFSYKDFIHLGTISSVFLIREQIKKDLIDNGIEPTKENVNKVLHYLAEKGERVI